MNNILFFLRTGNAASASFHGCVSVLLDIGNHLLLIGSFLRLTRMNFGFVFVIFIHVTVSTDRDALLQREDYKQFQACYRNKKWDDEEESK